MQSGRFRITWLMGVIALIALELGGLRILNAISFRAYIDGSPSLSRMISLTTLGTIPMANLLAIGLIGLLRRGNRTFLLGFEIFGLVALVMSIGFGLTVPDLLFSGLIDPVGAKFTYKVDGNVYMNTTGMIMACVVVGTALTLPQLAFALIGGTLFRQLWRRKEDGIEVSKVHGTP